VVRECCLDIFNLAPVGYCTVSKKGLIQKANFTAASLLGISRRELVKQPISRFIRIEERYIHYRHHVCAIRQSLI
jgi:PAS domain-containing protein